MSDNLFDDNDDAWSYSFPPSTESLTLSNKKANPQDNNDASKLDKELNSIIQHGEDDKDVHIDSDESKNHTIAQNRSKNNQLPSRLTSKKGRLSRTSSTSSVGSLEEPKEAKKDHLQTNGNGSHASSLTSLSLQSPFFVKSTPANPHTTKEDANSIISREAGQGSGFSVDSNLNSQSTPVTSSARSNLSNNIITHDASELQDSSGSREENSDIDKSKSAKIDHEGSIDSSSPKIITYRKSKRTISEGNFQNILEQSVKATPKEKFDAKLYVEEKFMDTDYRYATTKRTAEFHQLFRSLDLTDRLLDDFSCALSREILLQGRIYVSENNVCFSSNLLGWVTSLIIPQEEIIRIEKKTTAGLFPNGISIETANGKHNFASFISRDATFEFMKAIWQGTTGRKMEIIEEKPMEKSGYTLDSNGIVSVENECLDSPAKLESYILSIDGDEAKNDDNEYEYESDHSGSDNTSDDDALIKKSNSTKRKKVETVDMKILKFKPDSKYINMGPDFHPPTKVKDYAKENNETELCNETINAPLGIVFDLLFGSTNTAFHKTFLENHNASEISEYDKFHPKQDEPSKLERKISYRRALGYSIGPKSTRCEVEETIENLNFAENVVVISSTVTPDVPLGNSFSVKTRYCLSWGVQNSTILRISYNIKWTGSSWIKSVIEKQTLAGQQEATKDLIVALKKEIDDNTYYAEGPTVPKNVAELSAENKLTPEIAEETITSGKLESERKSSQLSLTSRFIKGNIVLIVYVLFMFFVILMILQMKIINGVNEANEIARSQLVVNSYLVFTVQALANDKSMSKARYRERIRAMENDSSPLWKWVNEKYGTKLNNLEKIEYLTYQLNSLYQKQIDPQNNEFASNIEENLQDLKRLVQDFNYQELLNAENLRNMLGDLI